MIRWLTRDWGAKVISLILAIGLWYYAVGEEEVEIKRAIPIEIQLSNKQLSILKVSTPKVEVTLGVPRAMLSSFTSEQIKAFHEVGSEVKTSGDYSFRLEPREIKLQSPYIRVLKIEPEVVQVTLNEVIIQKLEVKPNFLGEPAFGYKIKTDEIQLNPNAILLEGPKEQLESLTGIPTEPIDLVGRTRSFRKTVKLDLPSNVKALSEVFIDAFIPIEEEFDEKKFENVPVRVLKPAGEERTVQLEPEQISFVLKGSKRLLEKLESGKMLAYVDTAKMEKDSQEVSAEIVLPEGVSLKDDSTVKVKAMLKRK
ncbi:MAG TPA: CdaR family protein [Verrucomicrobiae bacterium]|jgi:YbbR domain-containing protein|nr:CdaR family protein [Verrucomicrobiae bacterium]